MRDRIPYRPLVGVFVAVVVLGAVGPGIALATTDVGVSVVVERGETVDDVTAAGGSVLVLGTVEGDVTAVAGTVVVTGTVTGDVTAVGSNVEVTGDVGGTVTTVGLTVGIDGTVGGDVEALVGRFGLGGQVNGSTAAVGGLVEVERGGRLDGQLTTTAVQTRVNGTVGGSPNGSVNGGSGGTARAPGLAGLTDVGWLASIGSDTARSQLVPRLGGARNVGLLDAYGFLVNLLFGAILVGLLPNVSSRISEAITEEPVRSGAYGVAVLIAVPILLVVLALSLFGLPIALAGTAVYIVAGWAGSAYGRFAVGTWLFVLGASGLAAFDVETEPIRNRWARLFVGYLAVALLLRIPYVGAVVDTVVLALGLGALASLAFDAYVRSERATTAPDGADDDGDRSLSADEGAENRGR